MAQRLCNALQYVPPERLFAAPDCGMKHLPRDVAFGKLVSMVEGTEVLRRELGAGDR